MNAGSVATSFRPKQDKRNYNGVFKTFAEMLDGIPKQHRYGFSQLQSDPSPKRPPNVNSR
jgi:hypothetical protein